ncbi:restriction endonuclease subunit S [Bacteroides ovatus]|uniref:restriction endonuclease subunit S n=1 Tax=Bacteroides ovatus TaxID=28116 RepID=UPI001F40347A|nr:restriction endonuclease subunit S [Bacteroides ovatus]MCE8876666.1 restriction endonuclease subunit S [Bacteroides ovatus]CAG9921520.1 Type I restriction-modification system, specificity subunit S [Bacteroides ovatus]
MNGKQLKNSILQWAIQGKLVPQDPNDEPASVLLEKIRTEKARLVKEGKIKKDKNESFIFRGDDNSYYEKFLATGEVKCIDEEIPFEIPKGWEWSKLSNVIELLSGQDFIPEKYNSSNQGIPYITGASNIVNGNLAINRWTETPTVIGKLGDLLIVCKGSGVGKMCICNVDKIHIARQIQIIRNFSNAISLSYVKSVVEANLQTIISNAQGVIPGISREHILNLLIPLPPTNEQYEIDKKLQEILPFIDRYAKSQEALDKLNVELLGNLKKSILQEAVQGRLVQQIAEEGTGEELLEQIKLEKQQLIKEGKLKKSALTDSVIFRGDDNKYFEKIGKTEQDITDEIPFDIPNTWVWVRHNDLFDISGGSQPPKSKFIEREKEGYIRLFQIRDYGSNPQPIYIPLSTASKISQKGDILLARYGASLGKVFYAEYGAYNVALAKVIPLYESRLIFQKYIFLYYCSSIYQNEIVNRSRCAQAGFNKEDLNSLLFPLPPLSEQYRIVEKYEKAIASIMRG